MNSPNDPSWIARDIALAVHEAQLAEHGGALGVRELGLLDSALNRPIDAYNDRGSDIPELAALYAIGIVANHPFVDGNKRVAAVLLETFLEDNGWEFAAKDADVVEKIVSLAGGIISEDAFTIWVKHNTIRER